ncbi:very short patch repair endonuclease [Cellulomonas fimi]|uniref:very short patch repair endonuclease n=1 Tax=Cellulomonas fimi TaxID=1708 RepID=UPI00234D6C4A|nr:very short patch repair endonuclease [Cellulomonas fimi]MDC7120266.1 very short patch repair endonuclease [Cellulomonas fimi]
MHPAPTTAGRSRNMRAIRRSNTKPELAVRRLLHAAGYRYRVDLRLDLPGARVRPDIVFTRRKVAVFIDSCFFHCCPIHGRVPAANTGYWQPKLGRNVERDRLADEALRAAGWTVVRAWSHELPDDVVERVVAVLAT